MEKETKRGGARTGAGRPKKTPRVKKQLFLNPAIVQRLNDLTADDINTLLEKALDEWQKRTPSVFSGRKTIK